MIITDACGHRHRRYRVIASGCHRGYVLAYPLRNRCA